MTDYNDLIEELHELADWIEKRNGVHCHSVPRKAAYLIAAMQEDNIQLRKSLNKRDLYVSDYINRVIGFFLLQWYLFKNKKKKKI
jgi:hypothetical protein